MPASSQIMYVIAGDTHVEDADVPLGTGGAEQGMDEADMAVTEVIAD